MIVFRQSKDPNDARDYTLDFTAALAPGEMLTACVATVISGALLVAGSGTVYGALATTRLTGGTAGETATVRYRVTTSTGQQWDCTASIAIREL